MNPPSSSLVLLVYFSGTGFTRQAALTMAGQLQTGPYPVQLHALEKKTAAPVIDSTNPPHRVILFFPVHALDAPAPVYEWLHSLTDCSGVPAAVLSVSGGGDVWPNQSCRRSVIRIMEKKGFSVFYENMLVMPSNWLFSTPSPAAQALHALLPVMTQHCLKEILDHRYRREGFHFLSWILSWISPLEKLGAAWVGRTLKAGSKCTGCSWCSMNCPRGNITLSGGRPDFGKSCILCMRCVYGCPVHSITAGVLSCMILKDGLPGDAKHAFKETTLDFSSLAPGSAWKGLRKYLHQALRALQEVEQLSGKVRDSIHGSSESQEKYH